MEGLVCVGLYATKQNISKYYKFFGILYLVATSASVGIALSFVGPNAQNTTISPAVPTAATSVPKSTGNLIANKLPKVISAALTTPTKIPVANATAVSAQGTRDIICLPYYLVISHIRNKSIYLHRSSLSSGSCTK